MALCRGGCLGDAGAGMTLSTHRPSARRPAWFVLVAAIFVVLAAADASGESTPSDAWVDWAGERALVLDPDEWPRSTPEELRSVTDALAGVVHTAAPGE